MSARTKKFTKSLLSLTVAVRYSRLLFSIELYWILMEAALNDLSLAEDKVCDLLNLAQLTCSELAKVPCSDADTLKSLSSQYMENIKLIRSLLVKHASLIDLKNDDSNSESSVSVQKQLESIDELLRKMND